MSTGQRDCLIVATDADTWQNKDAVKKDDRGGKKKSTAGPPGVEKTPLGYKYAEEDISGEDTGLGGEIHGVRAGAGEYESSKKPSKKGDNT